MQNLVTGSYIGNGGFNRTIQTGLSGTLRSVCILRGTALVPAGAVSIKTIDMSSGDEFRIGIGLVTTSNFLFAGNVGPDFILNGADPYWNEPGVPYYWIALAE